MINHYSALVIDLNQNNNIPDIDFLETRIFSLIILIPENF